MYKRTTYACFIGIFMQALITNLTAILFVPLRELYGLDFVQLGILVLVNFSVQVLADILLSRFIDRTPFKRIVLAACGMTAVGLALFACTPWLMPNHFFAGALVATVIFSFASGMCEVVLSPIVDNMPDDGNGNATAMSLMHSFYAWGQVATILLTTLALFVFGRANWQFIVFFWLIVPALCFAFFVRAPIPEGVPAEKRESVRKVLFSPYYLVALLAICFGAATEVVMNQWISTFAEAGLGMNKLVGDILGMALFAVWMGVGRLLYGIFGKNINIRGVTMYGALFALGCYVLAALMPVPWISLTFASLSGLFTSLLWPGTLVIATDKYPTSGAWLFAVLAIAGDVGAAAAPYITGLVTDLTAGAGTAMSLRYGLLASAIFPVFAFLCFVYLKRHASAEDQRKKIFFTYRKK